MQPQRERGSDYLVKLRTLRKDLPFVMFSSDESTTVSVLGGNGWEMITHSVGGTPVAAWKGYIDLSGYTKQEQTWFTRAVQVQGNTYPDANTTKQFTVHDIISTEPFSDDELASAVYIYTPGLINPETFLTKIDLDHIVYGRIRVYGARNFTDTGAPTAGATLANQMLMNEDFYGTNNGTARDKLYIYRVIGGMHFDASQAIMMGAVSYVISGAVDKEEDLEYIMRLKRAYETAPPFS